MATPSGGSKQVLNTIADTILNSKYTHFSFAMRERLLALKAAAVSPPTGIYALSSSILSALGYSKSRHEILLPEDDSNEKVLTILKELECRDDFLAYRIAKCLVNFDFLQTEFDEELLTAIIQVADKRTLRLDDLLSVASRPHKFHAPAVLLLIRNGARFEPLSDKREATGSLLDEIMRELKKFHFSPEFTGSLKPTFGMGFADKYLLQITMMLEEKLNYLNSHPSLKEKAYISRFLTKLQSHDNEIFTILIRYAHSKYSEGSLICFANALSEVDEVKITTFGLATPVMRRDSVLSHKHSPDTICGVASCEGTCSTASRSDTTLQLFLPSVSPARELSEERDACGLSYK